MPYPGVDARGDKGADAAKPASQQQQPQNGEDGAGPEGQLGLYNVYDPRGQPDPAAIAYFLSIPWCRAHLRPAEGRPPGSAAGKVIHIVQPDSRRHRRPVPAADGSVTSSMETVDNAFSTTLHTLDTIGAFIVFHEELELPTAASQPDYRPPVVEIKALMRLGPGLNGHIGVAHGGLVATILDEVLGQLPPLNRRRAKHNRRVGATAPPSTNTSPRSAPEEAAAASANIDKGFVTAYLNTTYVRPVRTDAPVLVTARYTRMEGTRKYYIEGAIWDDQAQQLAKADSLFVALKERL